jgi:hypothetical protein
MASEGPSASTARAGALFVLYPVAPRGGDDD